MTGAHDTGGTLRTAAHVVYVDEDYSRTVIRRSKHDHFWIMAREPRMADDGYQRIIAYLSELGYDVSRIEKVPQRW